MAGLITPEQEQAFQAQLQQESGGSPDNGGQIPPDVAQQAIQQGQAMAEADAQAAENPQGMGADAPVAPEQPPVDPSAQTVSALGFGSVEELAEAFKGLTASAAQYKDYLTQLLALQQSQENSDELDPSDPQYSVKKAIREEMAPLYEKMRDDARSQLIQDEWGKSALEMPDIGDFMGDITAYMSEHPDLSVSGEGLRRAYDGVRSKKYKSESQLLDDPEFIKRIAGNEKVKQAVLESHLGEISRNGDAVPTGIGDGGGTPLTGAKKKLEGMTAAKDKLRSMLGG